MNHLTQLILNNIAKITASKSAAIMLIATFIGFEIYNKKFVDIDATTLTSTDKTWPLFVLALIVLVSFSLSVLLVNTFLSIFTAVKDKVKQLFKNKKEYEQRRLKKKNESEQLLKKFKIMLNHLDCKEREFFLSLLEGEKKVQINSKTFVKDLIRNDFVVIVLKLDFNSLIVKLNPCLRDYYETEIKKSMLEILARLKTKNLDEELLQLFDKSNEIGMSINSEYFDDLISRAELDDYSLGIQSAHSPMFRQETIRFECKWMKNVTEEHLNKELFNSVHLNFSSGEYSIVKQN